MKNDLGCEEKIKCVLIANRAEISVRIIQALKIRNIKSISIFKSNESDLPHVKMADQAICLGSGTLSETYLNISKIITIALENNVDAIHPGYGFLSENACFAKEVKKAGLLFIGPSEKNIIQMGDKITSKEIAGIAGLPLVPGFDVLDYNDDKQNLKSENLKNEILKIGFPLLIKATAGGGGKGMKRVDQLSEFDHALDSARREAKNAFSNDKVFVEKLILNPRHIEIQVMCDEHGNCFHLFDRECSIQRRHQKVIEESPSLFLKEETRALMIEAALKLCKQIYYIGAGTIEFLVDENQHFYFLEMNTRLQVEHPVSEMVTGIDFVGAQIDVANGQSLDFSNIISRGHAIEVRVYAEDPYNNFLPQIGQLKIIINNQMDNVRFDFGYSDGNELTTDFDPMIGKIIVWGQTRFLAISKMKIVLEHFVLMGVKTNLSYLMKIMSEKDFNTADTPTSYIETHPKLLENDDFIPEEVLAGILYSKGGDHLKIKNDRAYNLFSKLTGWRV